MNKNYLLYLDKCLENKKRKEKFEKNKTVVMYTISFLLGMLSILSIVYMAI